jgi:exopolyphosphatase/guanosine-5'-triphosphate,3'-diphosphate pyrophosphatase
MVAGPPDHSDDDAGHLDVPSMPADAIDGDGGSHGVVPLRHTLRSEPSTPSVRVANGDSGHNRRPPVPQPSVYGALDLGTNNCRLLLAAPSRRGFRVVDSFSRIIRLGEGVSHSGRLSTCAMQRTIDALRVCAGKIRRHRVDKARLVATEACRVASNGPEFLERVRSETGLELEMLSRHEEARLAVAGCASLIDVTADYVLVFDIGGGSTEIVWLDLTRRGESQSQPFDAATEAAGAMLAWTSLPVGVVTLAETFGSADVTPAIFEAMVDHVVVMLERFEAEHAMSRRLEGRKVHLMGTSGTVTTVAGILLGLPRYDRSRVDGAWIKVKDAQDVTYSLLERSYEQRIAEPCVGKERADLVLAGCAILEALLRQWPSEYLRVADRGLREGILTTLMSADGVYRPNRRRRNSR